MNTPSRVFDSLGRYRTGEAGRERVRCAHVGATPAYRRQLGISLFLGQKDSSIKLIRQTTMTTTDLHGDDDQLAHDAELAGEGWVEPGISQTEPNSTVCGNNLEKNRKHRERIVAGVLDMLSLGDGDDKESMCWTPLLPYHRLRHKRQGISPRRHWCDGH